MSKQVEDWELRLQHDRDVRDGFVLCGNKAPDRPDPPNSCIRVQPLVFKGPVFWPHMEAKGHDSVDVNKCRCFKEAVK